MKAVSISSIFAAGLAFVCACTFVMIFVPGYANAFDCSGLPSQAKPVKALTFPNYLGSVTDEYGTKLTRITGNAGASIPNCPGETWYERTRSQYSTLQVWNCDESLLYLWFGQVLMNGETYQPIGIRSLPGDAYWHPTKPDIMIAIDNNAVVEVNMRTEAETVAMRIPAGYSRMWFNRPDYPISLDGRYLAVCAARASDGAKVALALDLVEKKMASPEIVFADYGYTYSDDWRRVVNMTSSGAYIKLHGWMSNGKGGWWQEAIVLIDRVTGREVSRWGDNYTHCPGHGDQAVDANGDDIQVGRCDDQNWQMVTFRYRDGLFSKNTGPNASHTSGRATKRPGWAFTSGIEDNVMFALNVNTGRVEHFANARTSGTVDYWAQPQVVPSWKGTRACFATNWGAAQTGNVCHTFIADFRSLCPGATRSISVPVAAVMPSSAVSVTRAQGYLLIHAPEFAGRVAHLTDARGATIASGTLDVHGQCRLSTAHLPGIYFVTISSGTSNVRRAFVE